MPMNSMRRRPLPHPHGWLAKPAANDLIVVRRMLDTVDLLPGYKDGRASRRYGRKLRRAIR